MRMLTGKVISSKMAHTVVVEVTRFEVHPLYSKRIRRHTRFHVHCESKPVPGEIVKIRECKPISRTKTWTVIEEKKKNDTT